MSYPCANVIVDREIGKTMRIIYNASHLEAAHVQAQTVVSQVEALANDSEWQATLAGIRERFPYGVMQP
jgi:hypothetical protein